MELYQPTNKYELVLGRGPYPYTILSGGQKSGLKGVYHTKSGDRLFIKDGDDLFPSNIGLEGKMVCEYSPQELRDVSTTHGIPPEDLQQITAIENGNLKMIKDKILNVQRGNYARR